MAKIELESTKQLDFEYQGRTLFVRSKKIGKFLVLSHLRCEEPPMPEISDNECRPIGVRIPKTELFLAIASMVAGSSGINSFQILEEDKAVFLLN